MEDDEEPSGIIDHNEVDIIDEGDQYEDGIYPGEEDS